MITERSFCNITIPESTNQTENHSRQLEVFSLRGRQRWDRARESLYISLASILVGGSTIFTAAQSELTAVGLAITAYGLYQAVRGYNLSKDSE